MRITSSVELVIYICLASLGDEYLFYPSKKTILQNTREPIAVTENSHLSETGISC